MLGWWLWEQEAQNFFKGSPLLLGSVGNSRQEYPEKEIATFNWESLHKLMSGLKQEIWRGMQLPIARTGKCIRDYS